MTKHHGIKVGDLVKFKHHMFDEHQPAFLVIEAWDSRQQGTERAYSGEFGRVSQCVKVYGLPATQRGSNFIVISRAYN